MTGPERPLYLQASLGTLGGTLKTHVPGTTLHRAPHTHTLKLPTQSQAPQKPLPPSGISNQLPTVGSLPRKVALRLKFP